MEANSPKMLYHGTIIDNVDKIKKAGLIPSSGDLVRTMYGEYEEDGVEIPALVFARDANGLKACASAIGWLIRKRYDISPTDAYSASAFQRYGALCVIREVDDFAHRGQDHESDYSDHPISVEAGDYYSENIIKVDKILTGQRLVNFFAKHGI